LGALTKFTGIEPGWIYAVFGLVATLIFFRIAIGLYEYVGALSSGAQFLVLPLYLWGGGLALLCGFLVELTAGGKLLTLAGEQIWGAASSMASRHIIIRSSLGQFWHCSGDAM